jgi:nucleotide-binding universal stress UspA family protein
VPYEGPQAPAIILAAIDDSPIAGLVTEAAARLAAQGGRAVHIVHATEAAVGGDIAVEGEELKSSRAIVRRHLDHLASWQIPSEGQILLHAGDHGAAGRMVAEYANSVGALTIVIGAPTHGGLAGLMDESSSKELLKHAMTNVLIMNPSAPLPPGLTADTELLTVGERVA